MKTTSWIVIGSVTFAAIMVALYFVSFHSGFSDNSSDWGNFGSYVSGALNVILMPITIYFVYRTFRYTQDQNDLERKTADLEIINSLYSDLVHEINNLQYRRLEDDKDLKGTLFTGLDAIYRFDDRHHHSPNSVLNHVNSIIKSFEHAIEMTNKVRFKYDAQKDIMLLKLYMLYYSKISWPVGHSIYSKRIQLKLDKNPDYPVILDNYVRLTRGTQKYLIDKKQIGEPITHWMIELLKNQQPATNSKP